MAAMGAPLRGQTGVRPPPIPPLTSIPVPYDPSELVTLDAPVIQNAEERAATLDLLVKAQRLSNVRLRPYDLKTTFTSYGSLPSDGRWILEDTSPGGGIYRWTAQGPSFSGVFLSRDKLLLSNEPGGAVPLRLAQVRSAIFGVYYGSGIGPYAALRVADGYLNGVELRCVLVARGSPRTAQPELAKGRSFGESEYCVDPRTGLLAMYSPVPGVYIHYDYTRAKHFHDITIADRFTISEGGKTIIEARTESVRNMPRKDSKLFLPAGLNPVGAGEVMEVPTLVTGDETGSPVKNKNVEVVVVHGVLSPDGKLNEAEVLTSTNLSLDERALESAAKAPLLRREANTQAGAAPHLREIIFTEEFVPTPAAPPQLPPPPPNIGREFSGVVMFDHWDSCYLISGSNLGTTYISKYAKEALRPYNGMAIRVDAYDAPVEQPPPQSAIAPGNMPGDILIGDYKIIGLAPDAHPDVLDGLKLVLEPDFEGIGVHFFIEIRNGGTSTDTIMSEFVAPVLLGPSPKPPFAPPDNELGKDASSVIITHCGLLGPCSWEFRDTDKGYAAYTIDPQNRPPARFQLSPGESRKTRISLRIPPGQYQFLFVYGGQFNGEKQLVSNAISFDLSDTGLATLVK